MPATATAAPAELGIQHRPIDPKKPFKWQTRRLLKPQPTSPPGTPGILIVKGEYFFRSEFAMWMAKRCRCGPVGRRLWVREAWATNACFDRIKPRDIANPDDVGLWWDHGARHRLGAKPGRRRNARHMPRWASRLLLEVVDVRVEELESMSEADAKAEGVALTPCTHPDCGGRSCTGYRGAYTSLWNEMHRDTHPWGSKPWVEVITYKRLA